MAPATSTGRAIPQPRCRVNTATPTAIRAEVANQLNNSTGRAYDRTQTGYSSQPSLRWAWQAVRSERLTTSGRLPSKREFVRT